MKFEVTRADLLTLKQQNPEAYYMLMSIAEEEGDYVDTLDIEKLKSECANGYFDPRDLFTKEQLQSELCEDEIMDLMVDNADLISGVCSSLDWKHRHEIIQELGSEVCDVFDPEDIFDEAKLEKWAEHNGFVEED